MTQSWRNFIQASEVVHSVRTNGVRSKCQALNRFIPGTRTTVRMTLDEEPFSLSISDCLVTKKMIETASTLSLVANPEV